MTIVGPEMDQNGKVKNMPRLLDNLQYVGSKQTLIYSVYKRKRKMGSLMKNNLKIRIPPL